MKLGIDAVGEAGGIIEGKLYLNKFSIISDMNANIVNSRRPLGTVCYTGDVSDPNKGQYNLEYYLNYVRELKELGIHVLAIKDMAGLLKPESAKMLISAIRAEHFDLPIHG